MIGPRRRAGLCSRVRLCRRVRLCLAICLLLGWVGIPTLAQDQVIYDDALASGFADWSWALHDLDNPSPVAAGTRSIAFEADGWGGVYFRADSALDLADWAEVEVSVHGGSSGGQSIRLYLQLGDAFLGEVPLAPAPAGTWETRRLDLRAAGLSFGSFDGIPFQDTTGGDQPTLYLDEISLIQDTAPPPPPLPASVTVDPAADRRPINPLIYGAAFGDPVRFGEVGYPLRRWGGNSVTRYNWRSAVHNTAFDYFFQNIVDEVIDPALLPDGSSSDIFVDETLAAGAEAILTAPAIGWTPLDARQKKWSFSIQKYGPQLLDECRFYGDSPPDWCTADSGSGTCDPAVNTTGFCSPDGFIVGNDISDTSQAIDATFVSDWVNHVVSRVGTAAEGGVQFWAVDNEPMLWDSTHRDIVPDPLTYDGLWSRTLDIASAIKSADPSAKVLGPVVWGWCAFFSSASDAAFPNGICTDGPDRQAHDGLALLPWYLEQVCAAEVDTGVRPIDYLDVHFYPQGADIPALGGSSGEDPETAARRMRSLKELWDPNHVSESWIGEPVQLIPRLRGWIDDHCPGVQLAITEYRWGDDDGPSSAVAHAEVLALFGREGVDMASRWVAPEPGSRVEDAFELFLNYDGAGARVDGDSVRATSDSPDDLGSYAIAGPDGQLWMVLINRDVQSRDASVSVSGGLQAGEAPIYRFDASNALAQVGTVVVPSSGSFQLFLPPRSATLIVTQGAVGDSVLFSDGFETGDLSAWSSSVDGASLQPQSGDV